jgi:adenylate cyclase
VAAVSNFFAELKRQHIYRVAAAYGVVAWGLIQLVNNLAPMLKLPDWIGPAVLILLLVGFPVASLFAWIHQLTSADRAAPRAATGKLDWALVSALVVVMVLVSYQQFAALSPSANTASQAGVVRASQTGGISIAVLPFANVSGDTTQEFFSDGMTDEIIAALTKVSALQVVGRESTFQFKGQKPDMHVVGQSLGAAYLIEGSVRKAGDRVRITAQLTRADNGVNLWADTYDRDLKDIFATQSDIAQAIADALRVPLRLKPGESFVPSRAANLDSYPDTLRARGRVRARGPIHPAGPLNQATAMNGSVEELRRLAQNSACTSMLHKADTASCPRFTPAFAP